MKTRERILATARQLFNEQGEHNVAASDIAMALNISPGNLYYHFKGKDAIHLALFAALQRDLISLLGTPLTQPSLFTDDEDSPVMRCWLFLTIVLEKMLDYRYLYDNLLDLMHRFPEIDRGVRRLGRLQAAACETLIVELLGATDTSAERLDSLVNTMAMTLTFWLSWDQMTHNDARADIIIHRGVLQLLSCCAPYMGSEQQSFYAECEMLYGEMVAAGQ